ncbi:MAG: hypothetical protein JWO80_3675, partial [Bryobacterales bacterium]|nr:hypothetical protein [Bryobacterales bacterium]
MQLRVSPTRLRGKLALAAALLFASAGTSFCASSSDTAEQFELKIHPLLANRCFVCHASTAMGGLSVDSREGLLRGGKSGPAIVPGDPEASLLIKAVRQTDDKIKMPMGQGRIPDSEIALLSDWVKAGAFWPEQKATA